MCLLFGADSGVNWVDVLSKFLPPFVALGGAIWLYFLQRRKDRADALRTARLNLYSDYLHTLSNISGQLNKASPEEIVRRFRELGRQDDKVRVLAPMSVAKASKEVVQGFLNNILAEVNSQKPDLKVDIEKNLGENLMANLETLEASRANRRNYSEARKNLLMVMRNDIFDGTGEKSADINSLWDNAK